MRSPHDPDAPRAPGPLQRGSHPDPDAGQCAMERVAELAGEPHSDGPRTTSPVLAAFVRCLNDRIESDAVRGLVLAPRLTALAAAGPAHPEVESARAFAAVDAAVRRFAGERMRQLGRDEAALDLARLAPVVDRPTATMARLAARACGPEVREAAWMASMAARACAPATVWVGACVMMAQKAGGADWPWAAATVLDTMIQLPLADALFWDDAGVGKER